MRSNSRTEMTETADKLDVSVVMCVYNGATTLQAALKSVLTQRDVDLELIVIDDGSTDGGWETISRAAAADERVRAFRKSNDGVCAARNDGVSVARSELVAFIDHDDLFLPGKLSKQVQHLRENPDVAVSSTFGWRIGDGGHRLSAFDVGPTSREQYEVLRAAGEPMYLLASSVVARKAVLTAAGSFRSEYTPAEDVDLWTRIADEHVVLALADRLVEYRVHALSASTRRLFHQLEITELIRENARRRRTRTGEMAYAEFRNLRAARPAGERLKERLRWHSRHAYRRAGGLLADRRPSGVLWLLASLLLYPAIPFRRLKAQFGPGARR